MAKIPTETQEQIWLMKWSKQPRRKERKQMRLIDADALSKTAEYDLLDRLIIPYRRLQEAPTVEAAPVVHAHWERGEFVADPNGHEMNGCLDGYWCRRCSHCHGGYTCPHRYCPNCGAYMDGGKNHETD